MDREFVHKKYVQIQSFFNLKLVSEDNPHYFDRVTFVKLALIVVKG